MNTKQEEAIRIMEAIGSTAVEISTLRFCAIVRYKNNIITEDSNNPTDRWIFIGEIPNMKGFCALLPLRNLKQPRIVDMDMIEECEDDAFMEELRSKGY